MHFSARLQKSLPLMALLVAASACGAAPNPAPTVDVNEIRTSVFLTVLVEVTLTAPASTPTPVFTEVPQADYPRVVASRFEALQKAFVDLVEIHNQFTADPTLSLNTDWYSHAVSTLARVTKGATEIAIMNNYPPEYAAFHQDMQHISEEGNLLFANYMLALDNQDLNALHQATANLSNMITSLNQAFAELNKLTPTATPVPTLVTFPTATLISIVPASPSVAGVCSCTGDLYNCRRDFSSRAAAQACYDYCVSLGFGDIHQLDIDGDGIACENLP